MSNFTNMASVLMAAEKIIETCGKLRWFEVWGSDPEHSKTLLRGFIGQDFRKAAATIADFVGCDLTPRVPPITSEPGFDGRDNSSLGMKEDFGMGEINKDHQSS